MSKPQAEKLVEKLMLLYHFLITEEHNSGISQDFFKKTRHLFRNFLQFILDPTSHSTWSALQSKQLQDFFNYLLTQKNIETKASALDLSLNDLKEITQVAQAQELLLLLREEGSEIIDCFDNLFLTVQYKMLPTSPSAICKSGQKANFSVKEAINDFEDQEKVLNLFQQGQDFLASKNYEAATIEFTHAMEHFNKTNKESQEFLQKNMIYKAIFDAGSMYEKELWAAKDYFFGAEVFATANYALQQLYHLQHDPQTLNTIEEYKTNINKYYEHTAQLLMQDEIENAHGLLNMLCKYQQDDDKDKNLNQHLASSYDLYVDKLSSANDKQFLKIIAAQSQAVQFQQNAITACIKLFNTVKPNDPLYHMLNYYQLKLINTYIEFGNKLVAENQINLGREMFKNALDVAKDVPVFFIKSATLRHKVIQAEKILMRYPEITDNSPKMK